MPNSRISQPHGGKLVNLLVSEKRAATLKKESVNWPSIDLTQRQLCDLELLMNGGFSPLTTFMGKKDYERVCKEMRLADGTLWPMPITLDVDEEMAKTLKKGQKVALRDPEGVMLAALTIEEKYKPDHRKEAEEVFGTTDELHPGVKYLFHQTKPYYVSGKLEGIQLPTHYDFNEMRHTPQELRDIFNKRKWTKVVAFQTRNPMHRAHVEMTLRAAKETEANLLIQPVVGMTKPGDVDHFTRVRIYKALQNRFPQSTTMIALLPLAMRMGGPREAIWHALIRKNYGATHFIVGRDHAGPGKDSNGQDFYDAYAARELAKELESELEMVISPPNMVNVTMVHVPKLDKYVAIDEVPEGMEHQALSGTQLRARLAEGREIPEWFTYPEVASELRKTYPPRNRQGFTVFFTGLSGSGKSTIANALMIKLMESGRRTVTLLDGDVVRKNLSSELGYSKEHRDLNIRRIGFVASEIAKHGGIAVCAPIAPFDVTRKAVRQEVKNAGGGFVLVYVNTPLEECEARDRKGLYEKARAGKLSDFTGISSPYEAPEDAEVVLDTLRFSPQELAQQLILYLEREGYITGEV